MNKIFLYRAIALPRFYRNQGFTLIELSIVLIIIGLLSGAILVGRDLIMVSEARAIMSQMEKFETAVNTFRAKFDCLPGDCPNANALGLGLNGNGDEALDGLSGLADNLGGNDMTFSQGAPTGTPDAVAYYRTQGEVQGFFAQLSAAGMIPGTMSTATTVAQSGNLNLSNVSEYFPMLSNGMGFITAATWNNKTYLRTGWQYTDGFGHPAAFGTGSLTGSQMAYIMGKFDLQIFVDCTDNVSCGYPTALSQKIAPLGVYPSAGSGNEGVFYMNPADVNNQVYCIDGTSTPYKYDTTHGYSCDMLWQITF